VPINAHTTRVALNLRPAMAHPVHAPEILYMHLLHDAKESGHDRLLGLGRHAT